MEGREGSRVRGMASGVGMWRRGVCEPSKASGQIFKASGQTFKLLTRLSKFSQDYRSFWPDFQSLWPDFQASDQTFIVSARL